MKNIATIFQKQLKDTFKNKTVLIQFVMSPFLAIIMSNAVHIGDMPENFFVNLFATMYIGMAPLTSMAAIISEEKEKNTLRVLMMSNVKSWEYIIGVGSYIGIICMLGSFVFCITGKYSGKEAFFFLTVMAVGVLTSLIIGAAIGTLCKSQMASTSITVPTMMVFSFLPMLSMFNDKIAKIARFTYSEQISILINKINDFCIQPENVIIVFINIAIAAFFFVFAYRKSGLS